MSRTGEIEHHDPLKVRKRDRLVLTLLLFLLLPGCASLSLTELTPSEEWYVVPVNRPLKVFVDARRTARVEKLYPYDRYQIVSVGKRFYRIRTLEGGQFYLDRWNASPEKYDSYTYPDFEKMATLHSEWEGCGRFSNQAEAQVAFAANPSQQARLDADGDGQACEHLSKGRSRGRRGFKAARGGSVRVKGHWRTTKSGKRVYVRGHTRKRGGGRY